MLFLVRIPQFTWNVFYFFLHKLFFLSLFPKKQHGNWFTCVKWALGKLGVKEWIVQECTLMREARFVLVRVSAKSLRWSGPPGIGTQSFALHHCAGGIVTWVLGWCSLGGPICRWSWHKKCSGLQWLTTNPDKGVHGAWEMPALLTADHRVKSRSDLISWRW